MFKEITPEEAQAFITARYQTRRGGREVWAISQDGQGGSKKIEEREGVQSRRGVSENSKKIYSTLPWLLGPQTVSAAKKILNAAKSSKKLIGDERFTAIFWNGVKDVYGGRDFLGSYFDFAEMLAKQSHLVKSKGEGLVFNPTENADGHRCNESTLAVHALVLDDDGRGGHHRFIEAVNDFCYIRFETGGSTKEIEKWRAILPLARPFSVRTEEDRQRFRQMIGTFRTVFGSLSGLVGEGFDPNCDTPAHPWYITERRNSNDSLREVAFNPGHALDVEAALEIVPPYPVEIREINSPPPAAAVNGNVKREKIVETLINALSPILRDRRDLYLALPGVLLDRGISSDGVLSILSAVSERCPGDPSYSVQEVAERHREHVHCAFTTISRFRKGLTYTRIGTLAERWPEVARALDQVFPHPFTIKAKEIIQRAEIKATRRLKNESRKTAIKELRNQISAISIAKRKLEDPEEIAKGFFLKRFLAGEPLLEPSDPEPLSISMASAIAKIAGILAFSLSNNTSLSDLVTLGFKTLTRVGDFEGDAVEFFKSCYEQSLAAKLEFDEKFEKEKRAKHAKAIAMGWV